MPEPTPPTPVSGILIAGFNNFSADLVVDNYQANLNSTPAEFLLTTEVTNYLGNIADIAAVPLFAEETTDYQGKFSDGASLMIPMEWEAYNKAIVIPPIDLKIPPRTRDEMKQTVLTISAAGTTESSVPYLAATAIGQLIELPFPVVGDFWVDPDDGMLYLVQSGKTIGSSASNADFTNDKFKELFLRLHGSSQILNSSGVLVTKGIGESDWLNNRRLKLPLSNNGKLIFTGVIN